MKIADKCPVKNDSVRHLISLTREEGGIVYYLVGGRSGGGGVVYHYS